MEEEDGMGEAGTGVRDENWAKTLKSPQSLG